MTDPIHKSTAVPQRADPRAAKTRAAIGAAFVTLLHRRSYARVRVSDITRKAKVGRATFYAHFASKDALLVAQLDTIVMPMLAHDPDAPCPIDATRLYAHVLAARPIFRALCTGPDRTAAEHLVQEAIQARVTTLLGAARGVAAAPALASAFLPRFVADTCYGLLSWALEQDPSPAAPDLQATFAALVGRALGPVR